MRVDSLQICIFEELSYYESVSLDICDCVGGFRRMSLQTNPIHERTPQKLKKKKTLSHGFSFLRWHSLCYHCMFLTLFSFRWFFLSLLPTLRKAGEIAGVKRILIEIYKLSVWIRRCESVSSVPEERLLEVSDISKAFDAVAIAENILVWVTKAKCTLNCAIN